MRINADPQVIHKPRHSLTGLVFFTLLCLAPIGLYAQISISKIDQFQVYDNVQPQNVAKPLNLRSHQDDAITSFNGYQYCGFYSYNNANTAQRFVTLGRRALPSGAWETIVFTDYIQTTNDSHNIIAIGICEGDGTIHLAFDHHNEDLNYRVSIEGLATNPQAHAWVAGKFNAVRDSLPGLDVSTTTGFTYPRFASRPDGDLTLIRRKGSAIAGKSMILNYDKDTHLWQRRGFYLDGTLVLYRNDAGDDTKLNGYLNGATYHGSRLHVSWVWRTEGTTSDQNFDLMYAYSDDFGTTWRNNDGLLAGTIDSDPMTYANTPAVKVLDFPEGTGLVNQGGQAIDSVGRVHVVQRKAGKFHHLYRNTSGVWIENPTTITGGRYKITTDQFNNVYLITTSAKIYAATPANNFNDWAVAYDGDSGDFAGDAMFDEQRMKNEGILTVLVAEPGASRKLHTIDLLVSPVSSEPIPQDTDQLTWNEPSAWNPDGIPTTGRAYTTDLTLRTPGASATFGGSSLTLFDGGLLQVRTTGGAVATVHDLILSGGVIMAGTGNNVTNILAGQIDAQSDAVLRGYWSASGPRNLRIESRISGDVVLTSTASNAASTHTLSIVNPANEFSGTWVSERGVLEFASGKAVGAGSIDVRAEGKLAILGDWNQFAAGASLTVADSPNASVDLGDFTWIVSSMTFGGVSLPPGHYTEAGLNGLGSHSVFTGSGSIRIGTPIANTLYSQAEDASVRETPDVVSVTSETTLVGTGGTSPYVDRCTVYVFQLPDLGPVADPFISSSLTFNYPASQGDNLTDNDLYGVRSSASPTVLASDYYGQTSTPDPSGAMRLEEAILTESTLVGLVETSESGSAALRDFLNAEYASGAGIGRYVFLRLNSTGPKTGINRATLTMSEGGVASPTDTRPRITYSTSPFVSDHLHTWRLTHFGTTANMGSAADGVDGNGDGESNLLEFATGQMPNDQSRTETPVAPNGTSLEFTYTRSKAAMADGVIFTVEWSDTLAGDSWSSAGVTQQVQTGNGVVQTVKATVPAGSEGGRFVHLLIQRP